MATYRSDPDALLVAVQKAEARQERGKLKIFFGMVAGVGKTYAMLETARQLQAEGVDVVVGYVETHQRPETEALLAGLEIIPRRIVEYRGARLAEMDLDAILARRPQLVLVDELAHTNAPGPEGAARHRKRYQDVLELLQAGIDVYTTVNVQHFESRVDTVRQITGVTVQETVPDSLLDGADEIELIDLAPDELRKRLAEGKVYTTERAELAANHFFRVGNLTALREMALRLTAEHVDHQLQDYMQVKHIAGPWKSGERLLVAISANPAAEQLIRWTRRMAYNLESVWFAAHVETSHPQAPADKERLARHLALVRELGGEVVITQGDDIITTLLQLAHQRNITQIVVGKPHPSTWGGWLPRSSLVDRLLRASGEIDVHVVANEPQTAQRSSKPVTPRLRSPVTHYGLALVIVASVTLINLPLTPYIGYHAAGLTELLAVFLIAVYLGRGPALTAAAISALTWNFLFIPPTFTFVISRIEDTILFVLYFLIAIFTGNLTARLRLQEQQARYNAGRSLALYALAHDMASAVTMADILQSAVRQVGEIFDAEIAILLPGPDQRLMRPHPASNLILGEKEFGVAVWVYEHGRPAGRFTDSLPAAAAHYLPLLVSGKTVGVIGLRTRRNERLSAEQAALLETFTSQIASVIQREVLDEATQQTAMLRESERLYTTLLNSISHELRTPIATITGAASSLLDPQTQANEVARRDLTYDIQAAAERLNRLVANLLDMSRLDAGRLQLKWEWCDVTDVISVALKRQGAALQEHPLTLDYQPNLPLVQMDFVLMEQVLVNLLDNACNYTPAGAPIRIATGVEGEQLAIRVNDSGPGIPPADLERIFEKFYRLPGTATGGTGLGLSICRGLVEAQRGTLRAENLPTGGVSFIIRLPSEGTAPPVQEATL